MGKGVNIVVPPSRISPRPYMVKVVGVHDAESQPATPSFYASPAVRFTVATGAVSHLRKAILHKHWPTVGDALYDTWWLATLVKKVDMLWNGEPGRWSGMVMKCEFITPTWSRAIY